MTATLDGLKISFQLSLNAENKSPRTIENYTAGLDRLISWLPDGGGTDITSITADQLRAWIIDLREAGMLPSSVATRYRAVCTIFKWAEAESEIAADPMLKIKMPTVSERKKHQNGIVPVKRHSGRMAASHPEWVFPYLPQTVTAIRSTALTRCPASPKKAEPPSRPQPAAHSSTSSAPK